MAYSNEAARPPPRFAAPAPPLFMSTPVSVPKPAPAPARAPAEGAASEGGVDLRKLQQVLDRFEITIAEAEELAVLKDYEIVVIADDSGSMRCGAAPPHLRSLGGPNPSRWDELKCSLAEIVEVATCFDDDGVDIFFLNRPPVMGIRSASDADFARAMSDPPSGGTPLTQTLERVAAKTAGERPVLLFIFTDGEPSGGRQPFIRSLKRLVTVGRKLRVQIMACTPEDREVEWLNTLDAELSEVDVTDDYYSEREEVLRIGLAPRFSRGDWCMKAMLGPVSRKFDAWDEFQQPRAFRSAVAEATCESCSVM